MAPTGFEDRRHDEMNQQPTARDDLAIGAEAWAIVSHPVGRSGKRRQLDGTARVRVIDAHVDGRHNVFRVVITRGTGGIIPGHEVELRRHDLFDVRNESRAFRAEVSRLWGRS
jgi:hypothetical protein